MNYESRDITLHEPLCECGSSSQTILQSTNYYTKKTVTAIRCNGCQKVSYVVPNENDINNKRKGEIK